MLSTTAEPPANPHRVSLGNARYGPYSETGGKPQDLVVDVARFRHQLSPEEGLLSTSRNAAGLQGWVPKANPQAGPRRPVEGCLPTTNSPGLGFL